MIIYNKSKIKNFILIFVFTFLYYYGYAQINTYTINYSGSLPVSNCNSFNVVTPYNIGGLKHLPVSGGVEFDGTNLVLQTQSSTSSGSNLGTAYGIQFPFKSGYTYTIQINAKGTDGSGFNTNFPSFGVYLYNTLPDPNSTNPTACGAVGQNYWGGIVQNYLGGSFLSQNSQNYTLPSFTSSTTSNSYLILLANGGSSLLNNALISSIVISEKLPFSLPPSVNITCGSVTPQIFTIANTNGTTGITNIIWNLGANNGWLYNGLPAPNTISTGTSNTLQLTPNCGSQLSSISASVLANGTTFNTNACNVAMTPISSSSLSIVGGNAICTSPITYSVSGLPCGAIVNWSIGQTGTIVTSTVSGNTITLSKVSTGSISLTATISNLCGATPIVIALYNIYVGIPVSGTYTAYTPGRSYGPYNLTSFNTPVTVASGSTQVSFAVTMPSQNTTYAWSQTSPTSGYNVTSPVLNFTVFIPPGSARFNLVASNTCGTYSNSYFFPVNVGAFFAVTPTLATSSLTVTVNNSSSISTTSSSSLSMNSTSSNNSNNQVLIFAIKIVDVTGVQWKNTSFTNGVSSANLSLVGIPSGKYVVSGFDGTKWESQQIIIQ